MSEKITCRLPAVDFGCGIDALVRFLETDAREFFSIEDVEIHEISVMILKAKESPGTASLKRQLEEILEKCCTACPYRKPLELAQKKAIK